MRSAIAVLVALAGIAGLAWLFYGRPGETPATAPIAGSPPAETPSERRWEPLPAPTGSEPTTTQQPAASTAETEIAGKAAAPLVMQTEPAGSEPRPSAAGPQPATAPPSPAVRPTPASSQPGPTSGPSGETRVATATALAAGEGAPAGSPPPAAATGAGGEVEVPRPPRTPEIEQAARRFIANLTEPEPVPIKVESADLFTTAEQIIQLVPENAIKVTTPQAIAADPSLAPDTPITVVRELEQVETLTPERVIAEVGGDLERTLRVFEEGEERVMSARELLRRAAAEPEKPIAVVRTVRYYEVTTPAELASDQELAGDARIGLVRGPYTVEAATLAELMRSEQIEVKPESVFYVRTVRPTDRQGIWGIIFDGLIGNFARGMALRRGDRIETYRVNIPRDADELLADRSSSFLGKLIYRKTLESYVYNYKEHRMGRNPDRVLPGQEIVIVNFEPEELIDIYAHFVERGEGAAG